MFQSMIEETKNSMNKETMANSSVIQKFYEGANIFITGGTGECAPRASSMSVELHKRKFHFSRFHGKSSDRQVAAHVSRHRKHLLVDKKEKGQRHSFKNRGIV